MSGWCGLPAPLLGPMWTPYSRSITRDGLKVHFILFNYPSPHPFPLLNPPFVESFSTAALSFSSLFPPFLSFCYFTFLPSSPRVLGGPGDAVHLTPSPIEPTPSHHPSSLLELPTNWVLRPNSIQCVSRAFLLCCVWPAWHPSLLTAMLATTPILKASR